MQHDAPCYPHDSSRDSMAKIYGHTNVSMVMGLWCVAQIKCTDLEDV